MATLLIVSLFISPLIVLAASTGSAQTASSSAASDLLNKITDKVAQMGQAGKRAYSGKIRSLGKTSINLVSDSTVIFVDTNEATKFYRLKSGIRTNLDFKNLKVNDNVNVIGIYDENTKTLTAKEVIAKIQTYAFSGTITTVSKNGIVLDPAPKDLINLTDLSGTITMYKLDSKNNLTKAKVTDPGVGDYISILGYDDATSPNVITALKFILIPQGILTNTPTATPSAR